MFYYIRQQLVPAFFMLVLMILLTGLIYPMVITGLAHLLFPVRSTGSFIKDGDKFVGSTLIGQPFSAKEYFWGRLSATTPFPYNPALSAGSNLGPTNPDLIASVKKQIAVLIANDPAAQKLIPIDLVTASASGLDPDISPYAAAYQVPRIAAARKISSERLLELIRRNTTARPFGFLGEPRVNVLQLNLALDKEKR